MGICGQYGYFDFQNSCIRESWSALLPAVFVFVLCFTYLPIPSSAKRYLGLVRTPFESFLTLHEAEALDDASEDREHREAEGVGSALDDASFVPLWRTIVFYFVGIFECFCWTAYGVYKIYNEGAFVWRDIFPFLVAISWLYISIRPMVHVAATPPFDVFTLCLILQVTSVLQVGGFMFDYAVFDTPLPTTFFLLVQIGNLLVISVLLIMIAKMPLAIPSSRVNKEDIVSQLYFCIWRHSKSRRAVPSRRKTIPLYGVGSPLVGYIPSYVW